MPRRVRERIASSRGCRTAMTAIGWPRMFRPLSIALGLTAVFGCKPADDGFALPVLGPSGITVSGPSDAKILSVVPGDSVRLSIGFVGRDGGPFTLPPVFMHHDETWLSRDTAIVTVDDSGLVHARTLGTTYVVGSWDFYHDSALLNVHPPTLP